MEKTDWIGGFWSAVPVAFWISFGLYAGPTMSACIFVGWVAFGAIIVALTWWQGATASRDSRQLKTSIAEALGIDSSMVRTSTDFRGLAARKILELEEKVAVLPQLNADLSRYKTKLDAVESTTWSAPSYDDRQEAKTLLQRLGNHSVQFRHTGQPNCYEFAIELAEIFRDAGWAVVPFNDKASVHGARGFDVSGKLNNELLGLVRDSLSRITRMGFVSQSSDYSERAEVTITIGPRKMRSGDWV